MNFIMYRCESCLIKPAFCELVNHVVCIIIIFDLYDLKFNIYSFKDHYLYIFDYDRYISSVLHIETESLMFTHESVLTFPS